MPATVAVLGGVPHVGLSAEQLQRIAEGGVKVLVCSMPLNAVKGGPVYLQTWSLR